MLDKWRMKHGFCASPGCGNASALGSTTCAPPANGDDMCYDDIHTLYESEMDEWTREGHMPMGAGWGE